jgi:CRP-like cAMP-binding protein
MELFEYLHKVIKLSQEIALKIDNICIYKDLPKGYHLLTEGSKSKKVLFIEKGLMRVYYLNDGKDITHFFLDENMIYLSIETVFLNKHFPFNVELLEDSIIRIIDYPIIEKYINMDTKLQKLENYIMIDIIDRLSEHLYLLKFKSAQERYNTLITNYPDLLLRVPLGHIASYLGITQSTLSVIRSNYRE